MLLVSEKMMRCVFNVICLSFRFKVNFGQTTPWFPPPPGFAYIDHVLLNDRVRASKCPPMKSDCEVCAKNFFFKKVNLCFT